MRHQLLWSRHFPCCIHNTCFVWKTASIHKERKTCGALYMYSALISCKCRGSTGFTCNTALYLAFKVFYKMQKFGKSCAVICPFLWKARVLKNVHQIASLWSYKSSVSHRKKKKKKLRPPQAVVLQKHFISFPISIRCTVSTRCWGSLHCSRRVRDMQCGKHI